MASSEQTFKINGQLFTLSKKMVEAALKNVAPDSVQTHSVKINGQSFPVKQALAAVTNLDRLDFQSSQARNVLQRLGFQLARYR